LVEQLKAPTRGRQSGPARLNICSARAGGKGWGRTKGGGKGHSRKKTPRAATGETQRVGKTANVNDKWKTAQWVVPCIESNLKKKVGTKNYWEVFPSKGENQKKENPKGENFFGEKSGLATSESLKHLKREERNGG